MIYGRVKDNVLMTAFPMLIIDGIEKWHPTDAEYLENGYKRVIITTPPDTDENHHLEISYTETDKEIHQVWEIVEGAPEPTPDEALVILLGGAL